MSNNRNNIDAPKRLDQTDRFEPASKPGFLCRLTPSVLAHATIDAGRAAP